MSGDEADLAQEQIEMFQRQAIARATGRSGPERDPVFDGLHCVECEIEIPAGRLALGKVRCLDCQTQKEKQR